MHLDQTALYALILQLKFLHGHLAANTGISFHKKTRSQRAVQQVHKIYAWHEPHFADHVFSGAYNYTYSLCNYTAVQIIINRHNNRNLSQPSNRVAFHC
jgi:hypothetical protein